MIFLVLLLLRGMVFCVLLNQIQLITFGKKWPAFNKYGNNCHHGAKFKCV